MINHENFLYEISSTIREAGRIILSANRSADEGAALGIEEKGAEQNHVNFVTVYDSRVQKFLQDRLHQLLPEADFFGEEDGAHPADPTRGYCFVVDPIDGTSNFIHDYYCSTISVALLYDGDPILGAVYSPYLDQLFIAEKGKGATCNGKRIHVSSRPLSSSLVSLGTAPYYKEELGAFTRQAFGAILDAASDIRRSGSAAYDFASVAAGRIDGFIEARLSPWDYAAGVLLVREAGGFSSDFDGNPLTFEKPGTVLCGGAGCYDSLLEILSRIKP